MLEKSKVIDEANSKSNGANISVDLEFRRNYTSRIGIGGNYISIIIKKTSFLRRGNVI